MPKRVLIIEDDPGLGQTMLEMMGMLGFEAALVPGVREALAALKERQDWNAVVSDFSLGDGKGTEVMRYCIGEEAFVDTHFVITSGYERSEHLAELDGLDKVEWLVKPYPIASLVNLIS